MKKPVFKKPTFKRPTLPSMKRADDPLKGLKETGSSEGDAAQELDAMQAGFRERAKQESQRFEDATDSGYYTCLVGENRAQLDAFLAGLREKGMNIPEDMFLDLRDLAKLMGIELPTGGGRGGTPGKVDKAFAKMVRSE